jgi:hypothetical protein
MDLSIGNPKISEKVFFFFGTKVVFNSLTITLVASLFFVYVVTWIVSKFSMYRTDDDTRGSVVFVNEFRIIIFVDVN